MPPSSRSRSRRARLASITLPALLWALVLAACGGTAAPPTGVVTLQTPAASDASAAPSGTVDPDEALLAFARCMRENGVDMPDPVIDASGRGAILARPGDGEEPDPEVFRKADAACRHHFAGVTMGGPDDAPDPQIQERLLQFARCMREQGVDMPDPQVGQGGAVMIGGEDGLDPFSDEFKTAREACEQHLPGLPVEREGDDASAGAQP